jgi:hypothetical protein
MDDDFDELLVSIRADTSGFSQDMAQMRSDFDSNLLDGFSKAGSVLESGLVSALRRGSLGFDDLKRVGLDALQAIAAQALEVSFGNLLGGSGQTGSGNSGGLGSILSASLGALFGLPGRAIGGDVSPGRPFVVGERGPELFVPTSAGRIETGGSSQAGSRRDVRVAINLAADRGSSAPQALQRSSRQVASAVRRALAS